MTTKKTTKPKAKKKAAKPKETTFLSNNVDLKLIRVPTDYNVGARGQITGTTRPDQDDSPWTVQFSDSSYTTSDPVLIDFLREHELFNKKIWEAGAAPSEPKPTYSEQMKAITVAAATRDVDELEKVKKGEKGKHNRPTIIQAADAAIEAIEAVPTELGGTIDDSQVIESSSHSSNND